jgi:hypothetical protein
VRLRHVPRRSPRDLRSIHKRDVVPRMGLRTLRGAPITLRVDAPVVVTMPSLFMTKGLRAVWTWTTYSCHPQITTV